MWLAQVGRERIEEVFGYPASKKKDAHGEGVAILMPERHSIISLSFEKIPLKAGYDYSIARYEKASHDLVGGKLMVIKIAFLQILPARKGSF